MKFTKKNYKMMSVGQKVSDHYIGSRWIVIKELSDGVILKNLAGGEDGVTITVTPETCSMEFESY